MKPICFELTAKYKCDSCSSEHYYDLEYVNNIRKILCYCGKVMLLDFISDVKIDTIYSKSNPSKAGTTKPQDKKTDGPEEYINQGVSILVNLGWRKNRAREKSSEAYKEWVSSGTQGILDDDFENFANYLILNK